MCAVLDCKSALNFDQISGTSGVERRSGKFAKLRCDFNQIQRLCLIKVERQALVSGRRRFTSHRDTEITEKSFRQSLHLK